MPPLQTPPACDVFQPDRCAREIRDSLLAWFQAEGRILPWRGTGDPYAVWVSEVMLQQTQVATVEPYYVRFLEAFPTVTDLARAPLEEVLSLWAGLGYYSRARNLHRAAEVIVGRHGGRIPADMKALLDLPGVGQYTAGAILSLAYDVPVTAVDGNVERVMARIHCIDGPPPRAPAKKRIHAAAEALLTWGQPARINQSLMELGALICRPVAPECPACPVNPWCVAHQSGRVADFPRVPPRQAVVRARAAAGIIRRDGLFLVARRHLEGVWGGLWEFPQVEVAAGGPQEALRGHLRDVLGLDTDVGDQLMQVRHGIMNRVVTLEVYLCEARPGDAQTGTYSEVRWANVDDLASLALSAPHARIAQRLAEAKGE